MTIPHTKRPGPNDELRLLLTVARTLRGLVARLATSSIENDLAALDAALTPFWDIAVADDDKRDL